MEIAIKGKGGAMKVSPEVFGQDFNGPLIHQVVTAYLSTARQGTKAQKTRAEVSGGGKKPWKQKGTGRARAGTTRGPLWRTGGVAFAAKPRDHEVKVNRKMYRGALRSIFSELARDGRLQVVDDFKVTSHKTKELLAKLQAFEASKEKSLLILVDEIDRNLALATGNLHFVDVLPVEHADPVSLIHFDQVVMTKAAIAKVEELLHE